MLTGAVAPYDQDRVGLKGHFNFDIDADENDELHQEWPLEITRRLDPATGECGSLYTSVLPLTKVLSVCKSDEMPERKEGIDTEGRVS